MIDNTLIAYQNEQLRTTPNTFHRYILKSHAKVQQKMHFYK